MEMSDGNQQPQFPRLAISDLLILTLSVAFALASIAPIYQEALRRRDVTAWDVAPDLFGHLAIGISLFGLIVLARQRIRRVTFPLAPGHWIFIATGIYSVLALASLLVSPFILAYVTTGQTGMHAGDNMFFVLVIGCSIVLSLPAMRVLGWPWRVCLLMIHGWLIAMALWLALDAARVFGYWPRSPWRQHLIAISSSFEILAGIAGVFALAIDAMKRVRRDWLHYFGVAATAFGSISVAMTWGRFAIRWWRDLFFHLLP